MAIRQLLKVNRKTFFDPSSWLGYDNLKDNNRTLFGILKDSFTPARPVREETFEHAMKRLGLTEKDIKATEESYRSYALVFLLFAIVVFAYTFYLFFSHIISHVFGFRTITALILGASTTMLLLSQAFKYHFWAFQIKKRKLGATVEEWKRSVFGNGNKGTST